MKLCVKMTSKSCDIVLKVCIDNDLSVDVLVQMEGKENKGQSPIRGGVVCLI